MNILLPAASFLLAGTQPVAHEVVVNDLSRAGETYTGSAAAVAAQPSAPVEPVSEPALTGVADEADRMSSPEMPADPHDIVVTARGEAPPGDPLQDLNVKSFRVVQSVDQAIVGPVAQGYEDAIPEPVRDGLGNALRNLGEPVNFLNFLLQFKIGKAAETLGRFAINSTFGIGGLFDVAKTKPFCLPHRPNGFANTLGFYGVEPGAYFYLPLVGPTTVRDMVGDGVDLLVLPVAIGSPFNRKAYALPATTIDKLNDRVERDAEIVRLREESVDPYVETRTLYLDMRQREIDALKGKDPGAATGVSAVSYPANPANRPASLAVGVQTPVEVPAVQPEARSISSGGESAPPDASADRPPCGPANTPHTEPPDGPDRNGIEG